MNATTALMWMFYYAAANETAFALLYGTLFPWRRTELGRQMLTYSAIVAALMDLGLLSRFWAPTWSPWVFVALYAAFGATLSWRLIILLRMRLADVRERHTNGRPESWPERV